MVVRDAELRREKYICRQPLVDKSKRKIARKRFSKVVLYSFLSLFFVNSSLPSRKVALLRVQESFLGKNSKKKAKSCKYAKLIVGYIKSYKLGEDGNTKPFQLKLVFFTHVFRSKTLLYNLISAKM